MLYYLFQWLDKYDFPGAGMFGYTSFRSLMAIILALLISSIWGDKFINLLKRKQITETQRDASIDPFGVNKVGVPSMGGVIIIFAILIPCLLLGKLSNIYMILMLITTIWLGSLGFADDYIKIFKKDKEGLHGKFKIIGQVGLGLIVGLTLYLSPQVVIRENIEIEKPDGQIEVVHAAKEIKATQTTIPFFKSNNFDYADLVGFMGEHAQTAGWILFVIITIFVVTAVSNGANLNDGMDGMAAGNSAIIGLTLGILAYVSSHIEYAGYLNIMYIPGSEELVIFICAFIGALIGFLWYNAYPAQVFMGDTGSLTIGGIIAVYAIIIHKELLIPILFGRTNTGKSLYAVQIAEHISGRLGRTVLYLDLELSMKQFQERYTSRDGELHIWPDNLHRPDLSMVGDGLYDSGRFLPLIRRMMAKVNARVLILDNLTFLVNNGGMKAEDVKPICQEFCNWAKEGYSILVVNHTPKIQPFTPLDINHCLGSSMLTNFVQSVFAIGTDSSNPSTGRYVKQLKSRNGRIVWEGNHVIPYVIDKTLDPTMLRFIQSAQLHQTGMDTQIPIQTARECDLLKDADNMQLEQIRKLHGQGMSNRKIAEKLNLSPATVGKRLKEMDIEDGE